MVDPKTSVKPGMKIPGFLNSVGFWKAMAFSVTGVYLYKALKANGGSFQNNPYGINLNTDLIVDKALGTLNLPPEIESKVEPVVKLWARSQIGG